MSFTRAISAACVIGLTIGCAHQPPPRSATPEADVRTVGEEIGRLWNTGDTAFLGRLLAPEFESYGATGQVRDKQAFLERRYSNRRAGAGAPHPHTWTPTVRILGAARDVAILTYDVTDSVAVTPDAPEGVLRTHLTDVFVKRNEHWLYVGFHESFKPTTAPSR